MRGERGRIPLGKQKKEPAFNADRHLPAEIAEKPAFVVLMRNHAAGQNPPRAVNKRVDIAPDSNTIADMGSNNAALHLKLGLAYRKAADGMLDPIRRAESDAGRYTRVTQTFVVRHALLYGIAELERGSKSTASFSDAEPKLVRMLVPADVPARLDALAATVDPPRGATRSDIMRSAVAIGLHAIQRTGRLPRPRREPQDTA